MNKDDFLARMERTLAPLAPHERIDILGDYAEHFRVGEESGKSDTEIAESLGSPEELAQSFLEQKGVIPPTANPSNGASSYSDTANPNYNPAYGQPVPPPNGAYSSYGQPNYAPNQAWGPTAQSVSNNQTLATVLVVLFNVFVAAPIVLGVCSGLLAIPALAISFMIASVVLFAVSAAFAGTALAIASIVCFGVALLALGILLTIATIALVRVAVKLTTRYIQFCVRICREGRWPAEGGYAA